MNPKANLRSLAWHLLAHPERLSPALRASLEATIAAPRPIWAIPEGQRQDLLTTYATARRAEEFERLVREASEERLIP